MGVAMAVIQHSGIYKGYVTHHRYQPKTHAFRFPLYMMYLDLDELPDVIGLSRAYSIDKPGIARFKREDFLPEIATDPELPAHRALADAVRQRIQQENRQPPNGAIRLLAHLSYFGYSMNPLSCFYCFDENEQLHTIVAEVNNTPWGENHSYVLPCSQHTEHQTHRVQQKPPCFAFQPH